VGKAGAPVQRRQERARNQQRRHHVESIDGEIQAAGQQQEQWPGRRMTEAATDGRDREGQAPERQGHGEAEQLAVNDRRLRQQVRQPEQIGGELRVLARDLPVGAGTRPEHVRSAPRVDTAVVVVAQPANPPIAGMRDAPVSGERALSERSFRQALACGEHGEGHHQDPERSRVPRGPFAPPGSSLRARDRRRAHSHRI
jgi:hypothetical protein